MLQAPDPPDGPHSRAEFQVDLQMELDDPAGAPQWAPQLRFDDQSQGEFHWDFVGGLGFQWKYHWVNGSLWDLMGDFSGNLLGYHWDLLGA